MRNRLLLVILLFSVFLLFSYWARGEVLEQIVAQVNNSIITLTQYNQEKDSIYKELQMRYKGEEFEEKYNRAKKMLLPHLIDELLLIQKAEEFGMAEDLELEANAYVEDMMKKNNIPNLDALKQEMARAGIQYSDYYSNLRKQILVSRLKGAMVRQKVKIMTDDIEKYYNDHIEKYTIPETVELEEIVMYTEDKEESEIRIKMEDVRRKLFQGKNFNELAKVDSDGPTAEKGGNIGSFPISSLSPIIAKAVAGLKEGQTSDIIHADFGFEIVRLVKRTMPQKRPLKDVRDEIEDQLFRGQINPILNNYVEELKEESYIFVFPEFQKDYDPESDKRDDK